MQLRAMVTQETLLNTFSLFIVVLTGRFMQAFYKPKMVVIIYGHNILLLEKF